MSKSNQISTSRTASRVVAINALYANDINTKSQSSTNIDNIILNAISYYQEHNENAQHVELDIEFLSKIVRQVYQSMQELDKTLSENIQEGWSLERLGPVIRAILRASLCELMIAEETPLKVIINEYVNITHEFFDEKEVGFVNGILDSIGHTIREDADGN